MASKDAGLEVGDLVWGRSGKHPFWPGLVTEDPAEKTHKRVRAFGPRFEDQTSFHVTFLGDNGQRNWVTSRNCFRFKGRESEVAQVKNETIKKHLKEKWELGVSEAESMISKSREQRVIELQKLLQSCEKLIVQKRKAKENTEVNGHVVAKKLKREIDTSSNSESKATQPQKATKVGIKIEAVSKPERSKTLERVSVKPEPISPKKESPAHVVNKSIKSAPLSKSKATNAKKVLFQMDLPKEDATEASCSKNIPKLGPVKKEMTAVRSINLLPRKRVNKYLVGDICWARFGKYPYWPCMVAKDPETGSSRETKDGLKIMSSPLIHVQFYGDKGRRSWVHASHVMPFEGVAAFRELRKTISSKNKKERAAFTIKPLNQKAWNTGVEEATMFLSKSSEERQKYFADHFPYHPSKSAPKGRASLFMKNSSHASKENRVIVKNKEGPKKVIKSLEMKRSVATNEVKQSEEVAKKTQRKAKKKWNTSQLAGCFKVFRSHTIDTAKKQYPTHSEEEIDQILQRMWDDKTDEAKAMYIALAPTSTPSTTCYLCFKTHRSYHSLKIHKCVPLLAARASLGYPRVKKEVKKKVVKRVRKRLPSKNSNLKKSVRGKPKPASKRCVIRLVPLARLVKEEYLALSICLQMQPRRRSARLAQRLAPPSRDAVPPSTLLDLAVPGPSRIE